MKKLQYQTAAESRREYMRGYRKRPKWRKYIRKYMRGYRKTWNAENPEKVKKWQFKSRLKWKYGISLLDWEGMLRKQGNRCAICRSPFNDKGKRKSLHVDHCHLTKKFRGLLCNQCNLGIGLFKESPTLLRSAILYVTRRL
jgi:Recombination endonuclease VII